MSEFNSTEVSLDHISDSLDSIHHDLEALYLLIEKVNEPDVMVRSWPDAKCHECGWASAYVMNFEVSNVSEVLCIADEKEIAHDDLYCREKQCGVTPDCNACPAFIRRPSKEADNAKG